MWPPWFREGWGQKPRLFKPHAVECGLAAPQLSSESKALTSGEDTAGQRVPGRQAGTPEWGSGTGPVRTEAKPFLVQMKRHPDKLEVGLGAPRQRPGMQNAGTEWRSCLISCHCAEDETDAGGMRGPAQATPLSQ